MMTDRRRVSRRVRWALTAALAGGSMFGACDFQIRSAIVNGSKDFLRSLLDPTNVLQSLSPGSVSPSSTP